MVARLGAANVASLWDSCCSVKMRCLHSQVSHNATFSSASSTKRSCRQPTSNRQGRRCVPCTSKLVSQPSEHLTFRRTSHRLNKGSSCWRRRAFEPSNDSFQFKDDDFVRVEFMPPPYGPLVMMDRGQGTIIFRKAEDMFPSEESETVEVFVGGDTCQALYHLAAKKRPARPMVLDLLWTIVERGEGSVLRVAITELRNDVFVGRLFMGDPLTKQVKWDCDCRPSDGSWLALQTGAPLYIHKDVWREAACSLSQTTGYSIIQTDSQHRGPPPTPFMAPSHGVPQLPQPPRQRKTPLEHATAAADRTLASWGPADRQSFDMTMVQADDLEVIILLKRELKVAIQEENYAEAIRIRDHPFMTTYAHMMENRMRGDREAAWEMLQRLRDMVAQNEAQSDAQAH